MSILPGRLSEAPVPYLDGTIPVLVLLGWRGRGPHNVLVEYPDGRRIVRTFRGLRRR